MEKLEATVDVMTAEAVRNVQSLLQALQQMEDAFKRAAQNINNTAAAQSSLGQAVQNTTNNFNTFSQTNTQVNQNLAQMTQTTTNVNTNLSQTNTVIYNVAQSADKAQSSVRGFLSEFGGIGTAIAALHSVNEQLQKAVDLRTRLTTEKVDLDTSLGQMRSTMHMFGQGDVEASRRMVLGFSGQVGMAPETTAALFTNLYTAGFDARTGPGQAMAQVVGQFAASHSLSPQDINPLVGMARLSGVKSPQEMQSFLAKVYSAFTQSHAESVGGFAQGLPTSVGIMVQRGMSLDQSLALYAASTAAGAEGGADLNDRKFDFRE